MALGLKTGFCLAESGFNPAILRDLVFAIGLALVIPFVGFIVLKNMINPLDAMLIGMITGVTGKTIMDPFTGMIFKGMLAFFLLDMGVATAKRLADLCGVPRRLALYGVIAPLTHVSIAFTLALVGG